MIWKLIRALIKRIRAWHTIKCQVHCLFNRIECEIKQNKGKREHRTGYDDFVLTALEERKKDLVAIAESMERLESRIVDYE